MASAFRCSNLSELHGTLLQGGWGVRTGVLQSWVTRLTLSLLLEPEELQSRLFSLQSLLLLPSLLLSWQQSCE